MILNWEGVFDICENSMFSEKGQKSRNLGEKQLYDVNSMVFLPCSLVEPKSVLTYPI